MSSACGNPGKVFCGSYPDEKRRFDLHAERVTKRLNDRATLESLTPAEWRPAPGKLESNHAFALLEAEVYKETGLNRAFAQDRFDFVRDVFLEVVQSHSELPQAWRDEMLRRIGQVKFLMRSELEGGDDSCGADGLMINAFAIRNLEGSGPRLIVLCPGLLLLSALHPDVPAFDYILAHELGHHIDSESLTSVGKDLVLPYSAYSSCLNRTLGIPIGVDKLIETTADYWGAEVFAQIAKTSQHPSPAAILESLSANSYAFCESLGSARPDGTENWGESHLPSAARMGQAMVYHPGIHKLLGCTPFTPANPGCDLSGDYPKN